MFRLAVQRRYKNAAGEYDADFFTVIAWRGTAELVKKHLAKGDRCGVIGSMQNRGYTDKSGANRTVTELIAEEVEFQGKRSAAEEAPPEPEYGGGFEKVDADDELPF